ncbi:MAG: hypothetical protein K0T99_03275 [Alphaproteobacteria bacterium]|nr:hypothetical protein [Alphaproteobacteria bacterium]
MVNLKERTQKLNASLTKLEELIAQNNSSTQNQDHSDLIQKNNELEQANKVAQEEIASKNHSINALQEKNNRAMEEVKKLIEQIEE